MRFLADESCDFSVVRALRAAGHDVLAVSEFRQRSIDQELMELAHSDDRVLLTEDKDFSWLVFVGHLDSPGVVLIRFPGNARSALAASVARLVAVWGQTQRGLRLTTSRYGPDFKRTAGQLRASRRWIVPRRDAPTRSHQARAAKKIAAPKVRMRIAEGIRREAKRT